MTNMLLDDLLPNFDVRTHHAIRIEASSQRVFDCLLTTDFDVWGLSRLLYALRKLPTLLTAPQGTWHRFSMEYHRSQFTLDDLLATGFTILGNHVDEELVLGTVGRFWRSGGEKRAISPEEFGRPAPLGTAKAAWNFTISPHSQGVVELRTETRVLCADVATRRRFFAYWILIKPFSGMIRREMLAAIRGAAETATIHEEA